MSLDKLRYSLTEHKERIFISAYENFKLLIHPSINNYDLLNRVEDDIKLLPEIKATVDKTDIKFPSTRLKCCSLFSFCMTMIPIFIFFNVKRQLC